MLGGINALNYDITRAVAAVLAHGEACCIVLDASEDEIRAAADLGLLLLSLSRPNDQDYSNVTTSNVESLMELETVEWWVGHDLVTGDVALTLRNHVPRSQLALFMHSAYGAYGGVKSSTGRSQDRERAQKKLFKQADKLWGVGPYLETELSSLTNRTDVEVFYPGLVKLDISRPTHVLAVIVFGRLDDEDDVVKQSSLAIQALADATKKAREQHSPAPLEEPRLVLVGSPNDDAKAEAMRHRVREMIEARAGGAIQVSIIPFIADRDATLQNLDGKNLCIVPSWHEGFGLSAWEAIGAEIPLIVGRFTGVYKLLDEVGGAATGCVTALHVAGSYSPGKPPEADIRRLSEAIRECAERLERKLSNASMLRRVLMEQSQFTWDRAARRLLAATRIVPAVPPPGGGRKPEGGAGLETLRGDLTGVRFKNAIARARANHHTGAYKRALHELDTAEDARQADAEALEVAGLRAEILLRLNQHQECWDLAQSTLATAQKTGATNAAGILKLRGILNTVERALGRYEEAVLSAEAMVEYAQNRCHDRLGGALRDLSRSLALLQRHEKAVHAAEDALERAQDDIERAKSYLALGEAYRHGFVQESAIGAYQESMTLSRSEGHYDCYLWAALGAADSHFLLDELDSSEHLLELVRNIIADPLREFPIETLHHRISIWAIASRRGEETSDAEDIVIEYRKLGSTWAHEYVETVRAGDYSFPKKF